MLDVTPSEAAPATSKRARLDRILDDHWRSLTASGARYAIERVEVLGRKVLGYAHAPATMRDVWAATAEFGDAPYLVFEDERLTYAKAHDAVGRIAAWLAHIGVRPGERVGIAMRNYPEWLLIHWACLSSGIGVLALNGWWLTGELAFALSDAAPRIVFCDAERLERLTAITDAKTGPRLVAVRAPAPAGVVPWRDVLDTSHATPNAAIVPDDDACILYTSGTTGVPKGAQLTHRGCVTTLMNIAFATEVHAVAGAEAVEATLASRGPPVALVTTPLFHVTALGSAHVVTAAGGTLVLMRKWDAGEALRLIEAERVTSMMGVPTMGRELVHHPDLPQRDLTSLAAISAGGAAMPPDLVATIDGHVIPAGPTTGYGMTETCGAVTGVAGPFFTDRPESCGRVLPTFEAKLIDEAGQPPAEGDVGELCVRGASVIKGFLNRPEATADTIVDGWLRTGDLARVDAGGFLYIVDRKKDMVLRGGENVYCAEVEAALYAQPGVREACVFGVPDERLGEEVGAAVMMEPGCPHDADGLRKLVSGRLAAFKVPRFLWLLDQPLPRNASGKILRRELRARLAIDQAR